MSSGADVDFRLHTLGWKAFQDLCATILGDVLGQTIQVFLPLHDGGRDGAFHGQWRVIDGQGLKGSFTVQCKFTAIDSLLSESMIDDEFEKAQRLAARGLTDNYLLMTNHRLTATAEEKIRTRFAGIPGLRHFLLFGREWITQKLTESSRLRMLVPRVYGLGDLSQILDERAVAQAREIMSALGDDLRKFVLTTAYNKAAKALQEQGFVILLGEPASGKSMVGASLAVGALDNWKLALIRIRHPDEFVAHWNPDDPRRFYWVDDAFGATQYNKDWAVGWNAAFPHMVAGLRQGNRFLFTSRDYIFNAARWDLKATSFPLLQHSQVIINVQELSPAEKDQILYNHLKYGDQPTEFRSAVKPLLPGVSANHGFLPEIARRLGSRLFTRGLRMDSSGLAEFVEKPIEFLLDVITNLDQDHLAALALIFMRSGRLASPVQLDEAELRALGRLGSSEGPAIAALKSMDGSLVLRQFSAGEANWTFKHPTIADALGTYVARDPELLDVYLTWTKPVQLLEEVTCGDMGIQGTKVLVPRSRYEAFAQRIQVVEDHRQVLRFLSSRSDATFLAKYIEMFPEVLEKAARPGPYLSAAPEVDLLCRLDEFGILPDETRALFARVATESAREFPDLECLSVPRIRRLLTEEQLDGVLSAVHDDLVPNLRNIVDDWRSNYGGDEEPEDFFRPLVDAILQIEEEFPGQEDVINELNLALGDIDDVVSELQDGRASSEDEDLEYVGDASRALPRSGRSVFDDVDA